LHTAKEACYAGGVPGGKEASTTSEKKQKGKVRNFTLERNGDRYTHGMLEA